MPSRNRPPGSIDVMRLRNSAMRFESSPGFRPIVQCSDEILNWNYSPTVETGPHKKQFIDELLARIPNGNCFVVTSGIGVVES